MTARTAGAASASSTRITIRAVDKAFPDRSGREPVPVLDDVTLEVAPGELVCLVGPSGCGKTTLLNLVAGLTAPDSGSVDVRLATDHGGGDAGVRPSPDHQPRIGYIFQQPRLLNWLSVEKNLQLAVDAAGVDTDVGALLGEVGLGDYAKAFPTTLSGGQRQRVAVARAFAIEPDVLLLDEPFSALDELTARQLRLLLQQMWLRRPRVGLFVTHNTMEAALLADRIVVFSDRPARIVEEHVVDIPRPRSPDDDAIFNLHRDVLASLI